MKPVGFLAHLRMARDPAPPPTILFQKYLTIPDSHETLKLRFGDLDQRVQVIRKVIEKIMPEDLNITLTRFPQGSSRDSWNRPHVYETHIDLMTASGELAIKIWVKEFGKSAVWYTESEYRSVAEAIATELRKTGYYLFKPKVRCIPIFVCDLKEL